MALVDSYFTGTISVTNGGTTVTGVGTLWTPVAVEGDLFIAGGLVGRVDVITDDTHFELKTPWAGITLAAVGYEINYSSILRSEPALTAAQVRALMAVLQLPTILYNVTGAAPDPGLGENGQYALKTNGGVWQQWLKVAGSWVLQATPVGTNNRGVWDSAATYLESDLVNRLGSGYISKTTNTNKPPESNSSDWDMLVSKGDTGPAPTLAGTSTSSITVGTGSKTFDTQAGMALSSGQRLRIANADRSRVMDGAITSYSSTTLVVLVDDIIGAGTDTSWTIVISGEKGLQGIQGIQGIQGLTGPAPTISGTSVSTVSVALGSKSFTTQAGIAFSNGLRLRVSNADQSRVMIGVVTSYSGATLTINVDDIVGAGSDSTWTIAIVGEKGLQGVQGVIGNTGSQGIRGIKGDQGIQGVQGIQGTQGIQGVGLEPDASGTLAQRATYDGQTAGYKFLETDVSPYRLWIKASNTTADWAGPTFIGGNFPVGDMGHITDSIVQTYDYGHIT